MRVTLLGFLNPSRFSSSSFLPGLYPFHHPLSLFLVSFFVISCVPPFLFCSLPIVFLSHTLSSSSSPHSSLFLVSFSFFHALVLLFCSLPIAILSHTISSSSFPRSSSPFSFILCSYSPQPSFLTPRFSLHLPLPVRLVFCPSSFIHIHVCLPSHHSLSSFPQRTIPFTFVFFYRSILPFFSLLFFLVRYLLLLKI